MRHGIQQDKARIKYFGCPSRAVSCRCLNFDEPTSFPHSPSRHALLLIFFTFMYMQSAVKRRTDKRFHRHYFEFFLLQSQPKEIYRNHSTIQYTVRKKIASCRIGFRNSPCIVGTGASTTEARTFKCLWGPGIDSKEWIPPAYGAWRAGTKSLFLLGA